MTVLLINKYNPDVIINIGTAGGVHKDLDIADFVVADKLVFHDVDVTGFSYEKGQVPGQDQYFPIENNEKFAEFLKQVIPNIHVGTVTTGDQFVNDVNHQIKIDETFDNVYAIEMESTAIVMTCKQLKTPIFVLRTISDLAYKESNIEFPKYLDIVSKQFVVIVKLIEEKGWLNEK